MSSAMNSSNPTVSPPGRRTNPCSTATRPVSRSQASFSILVRNLGEAVNPTTTRRKVTRRPRSASRNKPPHGRWPCCSVTVGYLFWVNVSVGSNDDPALLSKGPNQQLPVTHILVPISHQDTITNPQRLAASTFHLSQNQLHYSLSLKLTSTTLLLPPQTSKSTTNPRRKRRNPIGANLTQCPVSEMTGHS